MSDINERAALLFDMLDTDNSKSLEKREILKAMRDNKKVRKIIETSRSLEALLHPAKYKKMFGEINTTTDLQNGQNKPKYYYFWTGISKISYTFDF